MPTEDPARREADGVVSNRGDEAPWNEPASRSASEPVTASLLLSRTAKLPEKLKPDTHREAIFTSSGEVLRGERGQRAGKASMGRLGGPRAWPRAASGRRSAETIRSDAAHEGVGEARSSVEAGESSWSEGALAGATRTQESWAAAWRATSHYSSRNLSRRAKLRVSAKPLANALPQTKYHRPAKAGCGKSARPV